MAEIKKIKEIKKMKEMKALSGTSTKEKKRGRQVFEWVLKTVLWMNIILLCLGIFGGVFGVLFNFACHCCGLPQLAISYKSALSFVSLSVFCVMLVRLVNAIIDDIFG